MKDTKSSKLSNEAGEQPSFEVKLDSNLALPSSCMTLRKWLILCKTLFCHP